MCKRNIVARSQHSCCRRKETIIITYFECISVALFIQHAERMRHIVVCGVSDTIFGKTLLNMNCLF